MELKVEAMQDGATAIGVVEHDLVIGVLMIRRPRLVPIPRRLCAVLVAFILIDDGRTLVFIDSKDELLHLQAAMAVDGVKKCDLAVLVIQGAVEIVAQAEADAGVDKCGVVGRIHRQVECDHTVAAIDVLVGIRHLARGVIKLSVKLKCLTVANGFGDHSLFGLGLHHKGNTYVHFIVVIADVARVSSCANRGRRNRMR